MGAHCWALCSAEMVEVAEASVLTNSIIQDGGLLESLGPQLPRSAALQVWPGSAWSTLAAHAEHYSRVIKGNQRFLALPGTTLFISSSSGLFFGNT